MTFPKLSIITVNLNNSNGLRKTIESVMNQTWQYFEFIVIDGASTDGSVEIIKQYSQQINYWISEPDSGIYNAMNKGIRYATGEYCLFLNSGDTLASADTLLQATSREWNAAVVYGDIYSTQNGNALRLIKSPAPETITFLTFFRSSLPHPATFIRRSLLNAANGYDESLTIVSDWAFFIKHIILENSSIQHIPFPISIFDINGISSQTSSIPLIESERVMVIKKYFPRFFVDYQRLDRLENVWESHGIQTIYSLHLIYRNLQTKIFPWRKKKKK